MFNFAQSKLKEMDDALLASCICAKDKFRHTTPAWIEEQISIIYHEFKQKNVNLDIYLQEIKESIKEVREGEVNGQSDNN